MDERVVKLREKAAWYRADMGEDFEAYAQLCEAVADRLEQETK